MDGDGSSRDSHVGSPIHLGQLPEPGEVLHIKCGQVVAKLHMDRFICPGIHQECIEVEDGVFVTPKLFAVMGEKEKLKDWKNAIRLNGKSIRKLMELGELEFSRHNEICTGRCASRNLGVSKYDLKMDSLNHSDSTNESRSKSKSRRKRRRPRAISQLDHHQTSGDLANLRTLLTGPLLSEPGFSALREAQGEEMSPSPNYPNQPVFPSAVMVPANEDIKSEPTCQIKEEPPSMSSHYELHPSLLCERIEMKSSPGSLDGEKNHCNGDVESDAPIPGSSGDHDRKPLDLSKLGASLLNGGSLISAHQQNSNGDDNNLGFISAPTIPFPPGNKPMELNKDVMEAMKYANDLPDTDSLLEDSIPFWQSILDLGLIENFFKEIKQELDSLKHEMISNQKPNHKNAQLLSSVVTELGLMTKLKWRLVEAKSRTEREREDLSHHIEMLKKRVAETEMKQKELKRKSECFDSLADMGRKRRASSTPSSVLSAASPSPEERPT